MFLGKSILESQGYEVHCAEDGFEGLTALKRELPDLIISDLQMPNMNGFEFLSVVRQRFPAVPVIVISGECSGSSMPENVLADAFFPKGSYKIANLFGKIGELLTERPERYALSTPRGVAAWATTDRDFPAVTCSACLRAFPVAKAHRGFNETDCDFCASRMELEIVPEQTAAQRGFPPVRTWSTQSSSFVSSF